MDAPGTAGVSGAAGLAAWVDRADEAAARRHGTAAAATAETVEEMLAAQRDEHVALAAPQPDEPDPDGPASLITNVGADGGAASG